MKMKHRHLVIPTALAAWLAVAGFALAAPAPVIDMALQPAARNGVVTVKRGDTIQGIAHLYPPVDPGYRGAEPTAPALPPEARRPADASGPAYVQGGQGRHALQHLAHVRRFGAEDHRGEQPEGPLCAAQGPGAAYSAGRRSNRACTPSVAAVAAAPKTVQVWSPAPPVHVKLLKKPGPSLFTKMVSKIAGDDTAKKANPFAPSPLLKAPEAAPPAPVVAVSHRAGFIWPVRGQVISSYGPKDGGLYNDGINIAAPRGTPVLAAADGTVAYIGHTLQSYGNLVLIRHGGGMITAYAHLNGVSVRRGMRVRRGEPIGSVGSTGTVAMRSCISKCATARTPSIRGSIWDKHSED